MAKTLFILKDPPYGTERNYNVLRLAGSLATREGEQVKGKWLSDWLVSESAFVERVASRLPPTPPNFVRIVQLNETGEFPPGDPTDLEAGANRCAVA